MTSTPGQDRHSGFLEGLDLADNPGLEIVFTAEMEWLEPNARTEMESALATNRVIDLVYAHNDPGAHGAWLAARAADRDSTMRFVGIDALPQEGQQYVRQGILDATFLYPTGGAEAIETALPSSAGSRCRRTSRSAPASSRRTTSRAEERRSADVAISVATRTTVAAGDRI